MKHEESMRWMSPVVLLVGITLLSSCKHDMDDYTKQPYNVTDEERVKYAEEKFGVTIDPNQDWVLTNEYRVTITANANLSNISKVAVLDGNPYAGASCVLATATVTNDETVTLSFLAPTDSLLYAACLTNSGKCIARAFQPGQEQEVSFSIAPGAYDDSEAAARRVGSIDDIINPPTYKKFRIKDFFNFRNALLVNLPDKHNNTDKLTSDYGSKIQVSYNAFNFYELPLVFLGGIGKPNFETDNDNLGYLWTYSKDGEGFTNRFLLKDHFENAFQPKYDKTTKSYAVEGLYLMALDAAGKPVTQFGPKDIVYFQMYIGEEPIDEYSGQRVKVFQMNGELFVACEDGDDWDFNDRLFWFPYGTANVQPVKDPFGPIPSGPQVWTYAWEDHDFGDYDMNDCVIQVWENVQDKNLLDITLVALGATRELWLGFDNKNAQTYNDYLHVFEQELHSVLGIPVGKMANTDNGTMTVNPVKITVAKPAGFDFQKCSFILGAKAEQDMQGVYENDYYAIKIAQKGQDPHSIVIPGMWQWPKEKICIINAYSKFADWAHDIKDPTAKNWYMYPVDGKVVK